MARSEPPDLAERFRIFAAREAEGISPLYAALARGVADMPTLLDLTDCARPGQPRPNMLFAAVHRLLLDGRADPLAAFYPSLTEDPLPAAEAFPAFRSFCEKNAPSIRTLLETRAVGTNEVRRTACLLPAFAAVAREATEPLHLIEIGASAGLNLYWDRYGYDYGAGGILAGSDPALTLACELRGASTALGLPQTMPTVGTRIGIDPDPMDLGDPDDLAWLRALVWPEQSDRAQRLLTAARLVSAERPRLWAGDGNALLPQALAELPETGTACVFHSFTLNQFPPDAKARFEGLLATLGETRPLYRIGLEWGSGAAPALRLWCYHGNRVTERLLARCDPHGAWIDWAET